MSKLPRFPDVPRYAQKARPASTPPVGKSPALAPRAHGTVGNPNGEQEAPPIVWCVTHRSAGSDCHAFGHRACARKGFDGEPVPLVRKRCAFCAEDAGKAARAGNHEATRQAQALLGEWVPPPRREQRAPAIVQAAPGERPDSAGRAAIARRTRIQARAEARMPQDSEGNLLPMPEGERARILREEEAREAQMDARRKALARAIAEAVRAEIVAALAK